MGIIGERPLSNTKWTWCPTSKNLGLNPTFLPHSLKGLDFIRTILKLVQRIWFMPFLMIASTWSPMRHRWGRYLSLTTLFFENDQLQRFIKQKVFFLASPDTTMNHLMLHKLGIKTFMVNPSQRTFVNWTRKCWPIAFHYFKELIETGRISEIRPSNVGMRKGLTLVPRLWGHLVSVMQILVSSCCREMPSSREKSSVVASNPLRYLWQLSIRR